MGDRANIAIEQPDGSRVWLYGHWSGTDMPAILRDALRRGEDRWDDGPYLARIIFCEMVKGDETNLTGFGITTAMTDNEYPVLVVNPDKASVTIESGEDRDRTGDYACVGKVFSFAAFARLESVSWEALNLGDA